MRVRERGETERDETSSAQKVFKGMGSMGSDRGYAAWKKELHHATWASSVQLETARLERGTTRRQKIGN